MENEKLRQEGLHCFQLYRGYRDHAGRLHAHGVMRPALAKDELLALGDFRVHLRPESLTRILLARVILRLGSLKRVDAAVLERLVPEDVELLERLYSEVNGYDREPAS